MHVRSTGGGEEDDDDDEGELDKDVLSARAIFCGFEDLLTPMLMKTNPCVRNAKSLVFNELSSRTSISAVRVVFQRSGHRHSL